MGRQDGGTTTLDGAGPWLLGAVALSPGAGARSSGANGRWSPANWRLPAAVSMEATCTIDRREMRVSRRAMPIESTSVTMGCSPRTQRGGEVRPRSHGVHVACRTVLVSSCDVSTRLASGAGSLSGVFAAPPNGACLRAGWCVSPDWRFSCAVWAIRCQARRCTSRSVWWHTVVCVCMIACREVQVSRPRGQMTRAPSAIGSPRSRLDCPLGRFPDI